MFPTSGGAQECRTCSRTGIYRAAMHKNVAPGPEPVPGTSERDLKSKSGLPKRHDSREMVSAQAQKRGSHDADRFRVGTETLNTTPANCQRYLGGVWNRHSYLRSEVPTDTHH